MLVSTVPPDRVNLRPGELVAVACPVCGRWRRVKRHMLWPHRAADGLTRCLGSGQRIQIDLLPGEWLAPAGRGVPLGAPRSELAAPGAGCRGRCADAGCANDDEHRFIGCAGSAAPRTTPKPG